MSENAVALASYRVTSSDMSLQRSNEPVRNRRRSPEQDSATSKPALASTAGSQFTPSTRLSTPSVTFVVDEKSGQSFIQVIDRESGEILRQIPPEEARRLSAALKEMIGTVVDTVA